MTTAVRADGPVHAAATVQRSIYAWTRRTGAASPRIGIVLGTGLNRLLDEVREPEFIPYDAIPHMPRSTAPSHQSRLAVGTVGRAPVLVMDGRFHLYEGYTAAQVAFPIWMMKALGIETLIISNVAGGLNPAFAIGDLMLIEDHINLQGTSPLVGANEDSLGPRFPDMSDPYDPALRTLALDVAKQQGLALRRGVYAAMVGPQLETRAEYRWLRQIGADAVGMSTVPEVIAAVHGGLRVLAFSLVSDLCIPETLKPVNIEEIIAVANRAEPILTKLVAQIVERLSPQP